MYWKEIKRSDHFDEYHKGTLAWSDVVRLIYITKNKRKKGDKIKNETKMSKMLCTNEGS